MTSASLSLSIYIYIYIYTHIYVFIVARPADRDSPDSRRGQDKRDMS